MSIRDRVARLNRSDVFAAIAALSFVIFLINIILDFGRGRMGLDIAPFFGRVAEFLMLLLSAAAFAVATMLYEYATKPGQTAGVEEKQRGG